MGFERPSEIQSAALPILLGEPRDFLGLAATGTGKTAAFAIPLLEKVDPAVRAVQVLILCPTRELVLQTAGQINLLARFLHIKALPIYGGAPYPPQIRGLRDGATIVVGTPGRVVDHMNQGTLKLDKLATLILDEADEMISMGFKDDLETVLGASSRESCPIWLFSATMSPEVRRVADTYLRDPEMVQVNRTEMVPEAIDQIYYRCHEGDKPEIICKLIDAADDFYGLIFCQTKALVSDLTAYLKERGYSADCLQGDLDQNARDRAMRAFRERRTTVLVCTDVASRGLDVKDVTHVVNYSLPRELDNYVHRIGRTARSGKTGFAMSLVTPSHRGLVQRIERMTKRQMREGKLPTRKEIGLKKVAQVLPRFQGQADIARVLELMGAEWNQAIAEMSSQEVAARFLAMQFAEMLEQRDVQTAAPVASAKPSGRDRYANSRDAAPSRPRDRDRDSGRDGGRDRSASRDRDYAPRPYNKYKSSNVRRWGDRREERGERREDRGAYAPAQKRESTWTKKPTRDFQPREGAWGAKKPNFHKGGDRPLKRNGKFPRSQFGSGSDSRS